MNRGTRLPSLERTTHVLDTTTKEDVVQHSSEGNAKYAVLRSKKVIALVAAVVGAAVLAGVGVADIWSLSVSQDTTNVRMRVQQMSTANFDSGWHYHSGPVIVQVRTGALTFTRSDCSKKTYVAGDTFVEVPYVPGRVQGVGEATMTATLFLKYGDPLQTTVSPNPCP